ncbi:MAG: glycosyl transferase, partial [Microcystis panniformis WG22]|nr:glycosyl transferase [Microcystis panniformis WG22]
MIDSTSSAENEQEIVQKFQEKYLYIIDQRTDKLEKQKNNQLTEYQQENLQLIQSLSEQSKPIIVIDGVIFQINQGG